MCVRVPIIAMCCVLTAFATGCETQDQKDRMSLLEQENTELRAQLEERDKALDAANGELRQSNASLREQRESFDQQVADWQTQLDEGSGSFEGIEGVTATYGPNDVTISVEGDVLFDSGRTSLKPAAKRSLEKVARVIRDQYSGNSVIVAGHTDSDPIKKSGHKSNHHLGFERGWVVREYLLQNGLSEEQIAVISYGPDRPMGSAQQSRRVEIVVAD